MYFFGEIPLDKSHHKKVTSKAMLTSMAFQTAFITPMTAGQVAISTVRHGSSWWKTLKQARSPQFLSRT